MRKIHHGQPWSSVNCCCRQWTVMVKNRDAIQQIMDEYHKLTWSLVVNRWYGSSRVTMVNHGFWLCFVKWQRGFDHDRISEILLPKLAPCPVYHTPPNRANCTWLTWFWPKLTSEHAIYSCTGLHCSLLKIEYHTQMNQFLSTTFGVARLMGITP